MRNICCSSASPALRVCVCVCAYVRVCFLSMLVPGSQWCARQSHPTTPNRKWTGAKWYRGTRTRRASLHTKKLAWAKYTPCCVHVLACACASMVVHVRVREHVCVCVLLCACVSACACVIVACMRTLVHACVRVIVYVWLCACGCVRVIVFVRLCACGVFTHVVDVNQKTTASAETWVENVKRQHAQAHKR